MPPLNTLEKIIPNHSWDKNLPFPFNNSWGYHDACTGAAQYDKYYEDMTKRYGAPMNIDSFVNKMQLVNATGYQGIFEAAGSKISTTGGVMLWKLNAAFPSVVWQIYDWYLNPNAGYYFMKNACEPLHIQFNANDSSVAIVNRSRFAANDLTATAKMYSVDGKKIFEQSKNISSVNSLEAAQTLMLKDVLQQHEDFNFIVLSLTNNKCETISKNIYWTAKGNDYTALNTMPATTLQSQIINFSVRGNENIVTLKVRNTGSQIAFFTRAQLMQNGEEIMPSFWNDNYFSLLPNEEKTLTVSVPLSEIKNRSSITVRVSGWNSAQNIVEVK
jgi:hypothetical protein